MTQGSEDRGGGARMVVARGALAAERRLLDELMERLDERLGRGEVDPPLRVVVPSHALRFHLLAELCRRRGRGLLGLTCQTLYAAALEICARGGGTPGRGELFLELAVRRLARGEAALARPLGPLRDGFGAVVGSVRDLLDAGFETALAPALDEVLAGEGRGAAHPEEVDRARALLRVAAGARAALDELGVGTIAALLERAADLVRLEPRLALPSAAVFVHGFADATGVALDLLQALLERYGGTLILDHPPDPAAPARDDPGVIFTRPLRRRLELTCRLEQDGGAPSPAPAVARLSALGSRAEVREVAAAVRALLDTGQRPEGIGIVARELAPYRPFLRRELARLSVPFSAPAGSGPRPAAARRLEALALLLAERQRAPVERWLDALVEPPAALPLADLRLALATLGARRLEDLGALGADPRLRGASFPLPVRQGFQDDDERRAGPDGAPADGGPPLLRRRRLPGDELRSALDAGRALARRLAAWPDPATVERHLAEVGTLLRDGLSWPAADPLGRAALAALEAGLGGARRPLELAADELALLAGRALAEVGTSEMGGVGGGVRVLGVMDARGQTFEHLFLLGLNRGTFPRSVREDPLLPDSLRALLGREGFGVLPDLGAKRRGFAEERYLFAHLLSASPRLTLAWLEVDEDGRPQTPSPLVERLRWSGAGAADGTRDEVRRIHPLFSAPDGEAVADPAAPRLLAPDEAAILGGLYRRRDLFPDLLPLAAASTRQGLPSGAARLPPARTIDPTAIARTRLAVLAELDPDPFSPGGAAARRRLGPYLGLLGEADDDGPRSPRLPLPVTLVERLAGCPWQAFLQRLLRLEPPLDPRGELPALEKRLIGNLVHAVLERIVDAAPGAPRALAEVAAGPPRPVAWPAAAELERLLAATAGEIVRAEGLAFRGLPRLLAAAARPHLESARRLDWSDPGGGPRVLGVEVEGSWEIEDGAGRPRQVRFKADRVDAGAGGLELTDYKTGRAPVAGRDEAQRRARALEKVATGRLLQAAVYARAAPGARGRLLYLDPSLDEATAARELAVANSEADFARALETVARAAAGAWHEGTLFPRLVLPGEDREPPLCGFCDVAEACLRGDSGARGRLRELAAGMERAAGDQPEARRARAFVDLWRLAASDAGPEGEGPR